MDEKSGGVSADRRDFLKLVSVLAPSAAVATMAGAKAEAAVADEASPLMMDTGHTRAYYESARF